VRGPRRPTPEPTRTLAPDARSFWTVQALLRAVPELVAVGVAAVVLSDAEWVPDLARNALVLVAVLAIVVDVAIVPRLRWRVWRYEVRDQEIDLRRGAWTVRRTLVPMSRVQHVDTQRTVVSEMFGLASVVIHTAAGENSIPALTEADAAEIRDRIADLAATGADPV
jgi:membrane protein YdbS with pleckstrin-like domain